jgi:prepilin-type N-terminal cleavage/methylation domain-containing protein
MFSQVARRAEARQGLSPTRARRGFTLVELLVVITIIIILMGLLTPVIMIALGNAKEAAIIAEISTLDSAFKAYKEKHGSYPPSDFTNIGTVSISGGTYTYAPPASLTPQYIALANHIQSAFPRCNVATEIGAIVAAGVAGPDQAVPFWLSGFCTDVEHPISGLIMISGGSVVANPNATREAPLFPFDQTRLSIPFAGTIGSIYSPSATPRIPYVYFASQSYATHANTATPFGNASVGHLRPYAADPALVPNSAVPPIAVNPNSFQIISAGLDGNYGGAGVTDNGSSDAANKNPVIAYFPSGTWYASGDRDNLTNFSPKNLGDSIPK